MSKGGLGKSFEAECRAAWMLARGINWTGSDLDERHKTFSSRHPNRVQLYPSDSPESSKESFLRIFRAFMHGQSPVHIMDCRAQGDRLFIDAIEEFDIFTLARSNGISLTLFLFPTDEHESLVNMRELVKITARNVQYVVVENKARNDSRLYSNSVFANKLAELGAKTIRIPAITSSTMLAMDRVEANLKRGISFGEFAALETKLLDPIMASELGMALSRMYSQYDAIADLLLPPEIAKKVKAKATQIAKAADDSFNDMLDFNFPD